MSDRRHPEWVGGEQLLSGWGALSAQNENLDLETVARLQHDRGILPRLWVKRTHSGDALVLRSLVMA